MTETQTEIQGEVKPPRRKRSDGRVKFVEGRVPAVSILEVVTARERPSIACFMAEVAPLVGELLIANASQWSYPSPVPLDGLLSPSDGGRAQLVISRVNVIFAESDRVALFIHGLDRGDWDLFAEMHDGVPVSSLPTGWRREVVGWMRGSDRASVVGPLLRFGSHGDGLRRSGWRWERTDSLPWGWPR